MAKKLNVDNFRSRNMSVNSTSGLAFENDLEKFDEFGAVTLMTSKNTQSKLNSLFLDTR
jgi:hypothetical protein